MEWKLLSVRIGEWNTETELDCSEDDSDHCAPTPIDNKIEEKIVYSDYRKQSRDQHFDIALLRLENDVEFNEFVKPICLPLDQSLWNKNYSDHHFDVAGWKTN